MAIRHWMAWQGGVDLVALTKADLAMPNIIVHVAASVSTPAGVSPSGMILLQPDPSATPLVMGFVSGDARVGAYFAPNIFAGTPFEQAPNLQAEIEVRSDGAGEVRSRIKVGDHLVEVVLSELSPAELINREPAAMSPFQQQGLESAAGKAHLTIDGKVIDLIIPPVGITGGPAAVWTPCGIYAR